MASYKKGAKSKKKSFSSAEKKSYKRGFFAGLFSAKSKSNIKKKTNNKKSKKTYDPKKDKGLMDSLKRYRDRNLGVLIYKGKYYDTNFIDKPVEITKSQIQELHKEYNHDGKRDDIDVADSYVKHMRRKFGIFDREGNFIKMIGED